MSRACNTVPLVTVLYSRCNLGERSAQALGHALALTACLKLLVLAWNALGVREWGSEEWEYTFEEII